MAVEINTNCSGGGNPGLSSILCAVLLAVTLVGFDWENFKSRAAPKAIVVTGQSK